jgi:RIO kinase 1
VEGIDGFSRKILYSLQTHQDVFSKINGCVAQGKEAVIHHAIGGNNTEVHFGEDYAVKIYKTTKVEFRDREKYMEGEWRFRYYELVKNNPRKMIKLWAEKELRNLKRLKSHGILCPDPIFLKKHILVMTFIGKDGYPSPQLEKARLSLEALTRMYWRCVGIMRKMYQNAGLVHADLSPYNILVSADNLYVIDLAQAVTIEHAHAPEFLRRDCFNITKFFRSRSVSDMMSTRQLFEFIIQKGIGTDEKSLRDLINTMRVRMRNSSGPLTREEVVSEQVWMNINLPQNLKDVTTERLLEEGVYFSAFKDLTVSN